jgi:hypothetical protein
MRRYIFGILGLGLLAGHASVGLAAAPAGACAAAVDAVATDWQEASFATPAKPSQARVLGRHGYETTGPQFLRMAHMIGAAASACREGDEASGIRLSRSAQDLLRQSHGVDRRLVASE